MSLFKNLFGKQDPPENSALEHAMHEIAKNDNATTRESLYKSVLASTFIVEGSVSGGAEVSDGRRVADDSTRAAFKTIEHPPGNVVLPVFTDVDALTSFVGSKVYWIGLRAQELFQSIAPTSIAELRVNPFRAGQPIKRPGGIITRNEFMAMAQGLLPGPTISNNTAQLKVAAGQRLFIGKPAKQPPAGFLRKLTSYLQRVPELRSAYLFQMTNQNATSSVIGLHFAGEPNVQRVEDIMRGAGDVTRGEIPVGACIDFMQLKRGPFLDSVQKCGLELLKK
jgi:hypothetical protein